MARRRLNPGRQQRAQAEADLQYGPQQDNLALALQDAATSRDQSIRGARGTATAQIRAAHQASPALRHQLAGPAATVSDTQASLASDLAGVPSSTARAGAARDGDLTKGILADILASGLAENVARARDAKAGQAYAVSNARSQFGAARSRIRAQEGSLARQRGEFTRTEYDSLSDSAATRGIARGNQRISQQNADTSAGSLTERQRHDRQTEATARAKLKAKNGPQPAKPEVVDKAHATLNAAIIDATRMKAANRGRDYAKQQLATGRESQTIKNDGDGNPLPNPVKVPGVKQVKSQALAAAALDMAYRGYVSANTVRMLSKLGIKPSQLNLPTAPKTAPPLGPPRPLPSGAPALGRGAGGLGLLPAPRLH